MAEIEIDGRKIEVPDGSTVMEAAHRLGIFVPHFCYHKKLSIAANCRMCLVQVEKAPKPLPACATPVTQGMKVWTHSDAAVQAQKGVMEFLLINHPLDCPICDQGGECELQDLAMGFGRDDARYELTKRVVKDKSFGPLISTDMTRCIHCTRCVRFGQEVAGVMELGMAGRGEHSEIMSFVGKSVDSELSGNAIELSFRLDLLQFLRCSGEMPAHLVPHQLLGKIGYRLGESPLVSGLDGLECFIGYLRLSLAIA